VRHATLLSVLLAAAPSLVAAEPCEPGELVEVEGLATPDDDLVRVGELLGAVPVSPTLLRRGGVRPVALCEGGSPLPWSLARRPPATGPEAFTLPVKLESIVNTGYPFGGNDGLLWAGRGVSSELSLGAGFRLGAVTAVIAPELAWQQNDSFQFRTSGLPGDAQWADPFYPTAIDLPRRFGAGPFTKVGPGQSFVRFELGGFAAAFSTENLWSGPGIRNSIALSSTAPGFPHVYVGTSRPLNTWIGRVEAASTWGRLERTRYAGGSTAPALFTALVLGWEPRFAPGLSLGLTRAFLQPWEGRSFGDYFPYIQSFFKEDLETQPGGLPGDNPDDNQLASVFARWAFPPVGFEVYVEWAREDHSMSFKGFLQEPEYSSAVLFGFQKVHRAGRRVVRVMGEGTFLQETRAPFNWAAPVYYLHGGGLDYTHQGQLLGAWIGPGSDSQTLAVDVFGARGRLGAFAERIRRQVKWYIDHEPELNAQVDLELLGGLRGVWFLRGAELGWEASVGYRYHPDFTERDAANWRLGVHVALPLPGARALAAPGRVP
jgi:hypothetical protein